MWKRVSLGAAGGAGAGVIGGPVGALAGSFVGAVTALVTAPEPEVIQKEKLNLVKDHDLQVSKEYSSRYEEFIDRFGDTVFMCSKWCGSGIVQYKHYFITDHKWTLEFGGGDLANNTVSIHNKPAIGDYEVEKEFPCDAKVRARMKKVVGGTNYSVCLRNCEHVARYIHSGTWLSLQMIDKGLINEVFVKHLLSQHRQMVNELPRDLQEDDDLNRELFPGCEGFLRFIGKKQVLSIEDNDHFNVVVMGPTGCGKSSIINRLFNMVVAKEGASCESITRNCQIYQGECNMDKVPTKVNVIDTIGFCDSVLEEWEVASILEDFLKTKLGYIDRVVVVVAGRIELFHIQAINRILKYLNFNKAKDAEKQLFTFVYNKADLAPDQATLENNVAFMGSKFQTGFIMLSRMNATPQGGGLMYSVPLTMSLGVPTNASYPQTKKLMTPLVEATFPEPKLAKRISVNQGCTLL